MVKGLFNISMFLFSPVLISMIHIKRANRMGGGYSNSRKLLISLLYTLFINVCTFLVSCARGVKTIHFEQMTVSYRLKYIGVSLVFGLFFGAILLLPKSVAHNSKQRNYELDFLKLFFSICIWIRHTELFKIGNENDVSWFRLGGGIPVHFFFIISGMLMANSILNKKEVNVAESGKLAVRFVINKIKTLAWDVYAALFIFVMVYIFTIPGERVVGELVKVVPELLFVTRAGIDIIYNGAGWYLSAMFLCMLPIAYLLYQNRDFTLYIFAPLVSVFTLGYFCQITDYSLPVLDTMYGPFMGSIYRAVCGLCFGICAYNMYICLYRASINKNMRILLTVTEIFLYGVFFGTWFGIRDNKAIMAVILLLPIAIAITFSGKSYIVRLFQFDWMKYFAPISLAIYLNHWIGRVLVRKYFAGYSYGFCVLMMAAFTLCSCVLSARVKKVGRFIWHTKAKTALFDCE